MGPPTPKNFSASHVTEIDTIASRGNKLLGFSGSDLGNRDGIQREGLTGTSRIGPSVRDSEKRETNCNYMRVWLELARRLTIAHPWIGNASDLDKSRGRQCAPCVSGVTLTAWPSTPAAGRIYLANFGQGTVSVISDTTNKIIATIRVGNNPFGALYDPMNQKVYIADFTSSILSKSDPATNRVVASLNVGNGPWNIALDTANGQFYVTNLGSTTVTLISP